MSRVGKKPIEIPKGVTVEIKSNHVYVSGPKGKIDRNIHADMKLDLQSDKLTVVKPESQDPKFRGLYGLTRTLVANMVKGVTVGFEKNLEIQGVGYRAQVVNNKLTLFVGYSHPVEYVPPKGINLEAPKPTIVSVKGIDKELVGAVAAELRFVREPEPYKGKGIRYEHEFVKTKVGKAGATTGGAAKK